MQRGRGTPVLNGVAPGGDLEVRKMKILVVDDEPSIRAVMAFMLGRMHATRTAGRLEEAKDAVSRERFDLVISDLSLRGRHGTEGLELLSHTKKTNGDTEVIIMTGFGSDRAREDAYEKGAFWYVEKPIPVDELLSKVREVAFKKGVDYDLAGPGKVPGPL
jgi:DNA-binding NtrC family response regulator